MPESVAELRALLELEEIEVGLYRGRHPSTTLQRAFGGQVLAQALTAAQRTTSDDVGVHSLHAYFLRPGRTDTPIIYDVEILRDGRSFATRRVLARQGGERIFALSASFHIEEDGLEHADRVPQQVPGPEDCPTLGEAMEALIGPRGGGRSAAAWEREWGRVLDVRYAGDSRPGGTLTNPDHPALARVWIRVPERLADDPRLHQAALSYASDLTLLSASVVPHPVLFGSPGLQAASIDHSMWFHRPFRADEWLLYDQVSPSARSALGLSTGRIFQGDALVASVAQEGLIRVLPPR